MIIKKGTVLITKVKNNLAKVISESDKGYLLRSIGKYPTLNIHLDYEAVINVFDKLNTKTGEITSLK